MNISKIKLLIVLLVCVPAILFTTGCEDHSPEIPKGYSINKLGLEGFRINELQLKDNMLYAMTANGLYVKEVDSSEGFRLLGFSGKNIEDIVVFSHEHILASYKNVIFFDETPPQLFETTDGGETWTEFENNFGGGEEPEAIASFAVHPQNPQLIFGTGNQVIAKSQNAGVTWEPIWGEWQIFANSSMTVAINPLNTNQIWAGGQGPIENGYLLKLEDEIEQNLWSDMVPNPTIVKEIIFDTINPQTIYVGFEGALLKIQDNGATWQTLIDRHEEAHFFMGIGLSGNNPNVVYAGKWIKTDAMQPLELYVSKDKGASWDEIEFEGVDFGGVFDMKIKTEPTKERIFLALDKGGVVEIVIGN